MKPILFMLFCFVCITCRAQAPWPADSVNFYISKLADSSVTAAHGTFGEPGMDANAKLLYRHADSYTIDRLLDSLKNNHKTLACHVLLTLLLEPASNKIYHSSEDLTEKIVFLYAYNGLNWKLVYDKTNLLTEILIEPAAIKMLHAYWRKKKMFQINPVPESNTGKQ